jgi:hypothetical protein
MLAGQMPYPPGPWRGRFGVTAAIRRRTCAARPERAGGWPQLVERLLAPPKTGHAGLVVQQLVALEITALGRRLAA